MMRKASSRRTICEVLREIFESCEDRANVQSLAVEAMVMAKKMDEKLRGYKSDWDEGFFAPNIDHKEDRARRA